MVDHLVHPRSSELNGTVGRASVDEDHLGRTVGANGPHTRLDPRFGVAGRNDGADPKSPGGSPRGLKYGDRGSGAGPAAGGSRSAGRISTPSKANAWSRSVREPRDLDRSAVHDHTSHQPKRPGP